MIPYIEKNHIETSRAEKYTILTIWGIQTSLATAQADRVSLSRTITPTDIHRMLPSFR